MLGVFWNPQDHLLMMGTEISKIDASWAEQLTKRRVQFLLTPTVFSQPKEITILSAYHCRIQQYAHTVCRASLRLIVGQAEVSQ